MMQPYVVQISPQQWAAIVWSWANAEHRARVMGQLLLREWCSCTSLRPSLMCSRDTVTRTVTGEAGDIGAFLILKIIPRSHTRWKDVLVGMETFFIFSSGWD